MAPLWPSSTGRSQLVGSGPSGRVTVCVDPTLGNPALQNAQDLVNDADRVVAANLYLWDHGRARERHCFRLWKRDRWDRWPGHMGYDYTTGAAIEGMRVVRQIRQGIGTL
jgi:hypothetical protein